MIESIGSIGASSVGASRPASAASAPASNLTDTGVVGQQPISPRMKSDPVAGVMISEYLGSDGDVRLQFPSSTVVAYLRSGLTENGTPTRDAALSVQSEA